MKIMKQRAVTKRILVYPVSGSRPRLAPVIGSTKLRGHCIFFLPFVPGRADAIPKPD
ncbi:MAG: hypothetical protein ACU0C8_12130 [Roseovarius sp.]